MRCIILAGGAGTRLKPYTATLPKPLVPVGDYAVLELVIMLLKKRGIKHITLAVNHLAHLIQTYFSDGAKWGIKIDYSVEDMPLGTIGPLKLLDDLPENFIVMNGDVLTDIDFNLLYDYHVGNRADITVASIRRENKIDYGVIQKDERGMIVGFAEKPINNFMVSMGVYVINKNLLQVVPQNEPYGFDTLIYDCLKLKKKAMSYEYHGEWLDIGRPDDYAEAQQNYEHYIKLINM